ncbi:MAG: AAA family ATPase [Bradyrhizobium sp.]|uniref:AAA family ATPase n=1 Tax=Bradyrhizobium sp. TaxID=376 RepID=UPI001EB203D8|nr:AAA family ATPase [Bradyrhizobium sp.]MBU6457808.1 AAA family ATPase [Bradyrhizobium sp.]MDE2067694.1 AAA family ATPase [Bradyrhizobium sp.]MDE2468679.1 AAA family ATPase [Bradyrhizobium sp.]
MKLTNFSVENFRSVASSGDIPIAELTALVGRNESGKSNLLLALETVNPVGGQKDLDPVKNFPRGRHLNECKPETVVVNTTWQLNAAQTQEVSKVLSDHGPVKDVHIVRKYNAKQSTVELLGVKPPVLDAKKVSSTRNQS